MIAIFAQKLWLPYKSERDVGDNFKMSGSRFRRRANSFQISSRQRGDLVREQYDVHMQPDR